MRHRFILLIPAILAFAVCCAGSRPTLEVLSFNLQNLFDAQLQGNEYPEFRPAEGRWEAGHYHAKLTAVAGVLAGLDPLPEVLVFQEAEHAGVIGTLLDEHLGAADHRVVPSFEMPESAIQVVVATSLPIREVRTHAVFLPGQGVQRPVVEVVLSVGDSLVAVLGNHWKSRREGEEATEAARRLAASLVAARVRGLRERGIERVVVAGDLNARPLPGGGRGWALELDGSGSGAPIRLGPPGQGRRAESGEGEQGGLLLVDPWLNEAPITPPGSYVFRGSWEQLDRILFTPALDSPGPLSFQSFAVLATDASRSADGTPRRFDPDRRAGVSDHFPILARFGPSPTHPLR